MSNETNHFALKREHETSARQTLAPFEEAPAEPEADWVGDAFMRGAGTKPASVATALSHVDSGMRVRAVSRLQQEHGNAYVCRRRDQSISPGIHTLMLTLSCICPDAIGIRESL